MAEETVLITGGAGFIGSHLTAAYLDAGYRAAVVDDLSTGKRANVDPRADFYEISVTDPEIERVFAQVKPAIVSHHAAQASVRRSVEDPAGDANVNIIGSLNLLEAAVRHGVKKVIFASTGGAIYGEQDYFPADEDHPHRPLAPYGAAKAAVEIYLHYYYAQYGLAYTALRYANVYGPRQDPHGEAGVVAIFSRQMIAGAQPVINGDGLQTRDFVNVEDVVGANMVATAADFTGAVNIGTGLETSVLALFGLLKEAAGADCEPVFGPAKPGEQLRSVLDASLAKSALGWEPRVSLAEGLKRTVEYFQAETHMENGAAR